MENSFQIPLDLSDVRILEVSKTQKGDWLIKVESTRKTAICHQCGRKIHDFHGYDTSLRLRHLPLFEVPVYVEIRPKRYRCSDCDNTPTSTQSLDWYESRSPNTKPYENWLLRLLVNSTVADVARKLEINEGIVTSALERWVAKEVDWTEVSELSVLGLDEIALKRGHQDFVVLLTTPTVSGVEILGVLENRKRETVATFLQSIPQGLRHAVERVCCDMYSGFSSAAREHLPKAKIVIDRFHVAKGYRKSADRVRQRELKRLRQTLTHVQYQELKGILWAFRKRPENLNDKQKDLLERFFTLSPESERAYQCREELTHIFEQHCSKSTATQAIRDWCEQVKDSGLKEFEPFLATLDRWFDEITNYFLEGWTSGFVEGFNNRVKVLKRRCYGIFNVKTLFQRIYLDLNGYDKFARD